MNKYKYPIKVGFTGSHGVGKTTLSNQIKNELAKLNISSIVLETPRYICSLAKDKEYLRRGHNNPIKQSLILLGQVINEYKSTLNNGIDVQICDRTIIDHWGYTMALFKEDFQSEALEQLFEHFILEHYNSYDLVYYYPIERLAIDDGVREDDAEFQKKIDKIIYGLLSNYRLPYKRISSKKEGYIAEVVDDILKLLNPMNPQ